MTTQRLSLEDLLDNRWAARERRDEKAFERRMKLEEKAETMVGELCREGNPVYYVTLDFRTGRIVERNSKQEVIDYLIRNKYVM